MTPDWTQYIVPGFLLATRLTGVMLIAPFFGADAIPARVKAGLVIALTAVYLPLLPNAAEAHPLSALAGGILGELIIGLLLGLSLLFVFEAVQLAGNVAGFQMGLALETAIDPTSAADSTVMATLNQLMVLYLFLQLGVHRWVIRAIGNSFTLMPLGAPLASRSMHDLFSLAGNIWVWGLQLALPVMFVTLIIDFALGFFAKLAPQMPVMFVGIPVKIMVGFSVLIAAVRWWPNILANHFHTVLDFFVTHLGRV